jgi:hypothetical protein
MGMVVTAMVGLFIAMGELSRLAGEAPDSEGRSWPFNTLMGPSPSADGWYSVPTGDLGAALSTWLTWYLALDLVFIVLYAWLARRIWLANPPPPAADPADPPAARAARYASACRGLAVVLGFLAAVDLCEDLLAFAVGRPAAATNPLVGPLVLVSSLKWIVVLGVVVLAGLACWRAAALPAAAGFRAAMFTQRFSLVFLAPVVLLTLVPGANILDQLPDIERSWVGGSWPQGAWAAVVLVLIALALFVLGRLRSDYLSSRIGPPPPVDVRERSRLWVWFGVGGFTIVCGVAAQLLGWGAVRWGMVAVFAGIPIAVAGISQAIRTLQGRATAPPWVASLAAKPKPPPTPVQVAWAAGMGDVAAVAVGALGLVRSFAAPVALIALPQEEDLRWPVALLVGGAVLAVAVWPASAWLVGRIAPVNRLGALLTPGDPTTLSPKWAGWLAMGSLLLLLGTATLPGIVGGTGTVVATVLPIGLIALALGFAAVLGQDRRPPEAFWFRLPVLQVKSAPIFALLFAVILAAGVQPASVDVHGIRGTGKSPADPPDRPSLGRAFADWVNATQGCGIVRSEGGREFRVRVMPLVAAEGGGIRAAYWTTAGLDLLSGRAVLAGSQHLVAPPVPVPDARCRVALLSGGASGGSVGLTISRFAGATPARAQVIAMSGSSALAEAALGMIVRDTVYLATGVPFPSTTGWQDRAALIEDAWTRQWHPDGDPGAERGALSGPFLPPVATAADAVSTPPGFLVLNTTLVSTGCRVLISQLQLPHDSDARPSDVQCDRALTADGTTSVANSLDYFSFFTARKEDATGGSGTPDGPARTPVCTGNLQAVTAALMTARFPYVTPSGVLGPCHGEGISQFVDGGYVENSGIATITDLAPSWSQLVRDHNDASLAGTGTVDLIVPMVVYFDNDTNGDLAAPTPGTTMEGIVPITAFLRTRGVMGAVPALLQRAADVTDSSRLWAATPASAAAAAAVAAVRPRGVIVVNQSIAPAVTAPLGWSMSQQSVDSMNAALGRQLTHSCLDGQGTVPAESTSLVCARGFGSLADALAAFGSRAP